MTETAAGPFAVGDRVLVPPFGAEGEIDAVGPTETIRAYGVGIAEEGEIRNVTIYEVRFDNGMVRNVADRDGHIVRI
jgi:hypothetical protein